MMNFHLFTDLQLQWEAFLAKVANIYKSWTIWFNGLLAVAPFILDQLPLMQPFMPANLYAWAFGIGILGNVILRFRTTTSLASK